MKNIECLRLLALRSRSVDDPATARAALERALWAVVTPDPTERDTALEEARRILLRLPLPPEDLAA